MRPHSRNGIDGLLRKPFPAAVRVAVCIVGAHGQTSVEHENALLGPGRQQPVGGGDFKRWVVVLDTFVDIF